MLSLYDLSSQGKYDEILNSPIEGDPLSQYITYYYRYLSAYYTNNRNIVIDSVNNMNRLINEHNSVLEYYINNKISIDANLEYGKKFTGLTHAVLIPCYKNHICKLQRLLDSIECQTRYPDEIIVFVSSSTMEDLKDIRLPKNTSIYVTQSRSNASNARNRLFHLSNSDVLSFFDADDVMHPQRCEFMSRAIEEGADVCTAMLSKFPLPNDVLEHTRTIPMKQYVNDNYHHGCPTLRRTVMEKIKYDTNKHIGEDHDFLNRCVGYRGSLVPLVLTYYDQTNRQSIVGRLVGGLGNQLFIVAKVLYFAHKYRMIPKFYLDNHERSQGYPTGKYKRIMSNVLANQFNIEEHHAIIEEKQLQYYDVDEDIKKAFYQSHNVLLHGYWQTEMYFPNFKQEMMKYCNITLDNVRTEDECLIMVRRGDYLKYANVHNPCGLDYYKEAIKIMGDKKYYITSDDIEYCKKEFPDYEIIDGDDEDIFMECCKFKNFIISNSSYHWFVSYFTNSSRVIAPSNWILGKEMTSIYRDDMLVLNR